MRARLVAIGYVTGPGTELLPERIIPDFLMRHPSVRAARFRQSDVETIQTSITTVQSANEKARTETTAQMAQYRDRMLAVV